MITVQNPFEAILSKLAELKAEIRKIKPPEPPAKLPDALTIDQAIQFLEENGLPVTKAQVYKLSFLNEIPASRIGKRLVFSRKDLLTWIQARTIPKVSPQQKAAEKLAQSARRRERAGA